MKLSSQIIATTHVDLHSERMTVGALESLVELINGSHTPVGIQHDPRIAPVGRVASARVRKLDDGEYAAEAVVELFEPGDEIRLIDGDRELPIHRCEGQGLEVLYDRNFRDSEDQVLIQRIGGLFGTRPQEEVKKAVDPLTVLSIGGVFVLGCIAKGFLTKLGGDAYESLKDCLKKLFARRKAGENLLVFRAVVTTPGYDAEVVVVLSNPSDADIEDFLELALPMLDELVQACWDPQSGLKRLVFEYSDKRLTLKFGVRKDAVPLYPKNVGEG